MSQFLTLAVEDGSILTIRARWPHGANVRATINLALTSDADWPASRDIAALATGADAFILNAQRRAWLNGRAKRAVTGA